VFHHNKILEKLNSFSSQLLTILCEKVVVTGSSVPVYRFPAAVSLLEEFFIDGIDLREEHTHYQKQTNVGLNRLKERVKEILSLSSS
jgi:hypothetical protein